MTLIKLLLLICTCCAITELQAQSKEKMLRFRTGDSLWIYQRAFGANRLFVGDEMVTRKQWLKHLEMGDAEVNQIMQEANRIRRTGIYISAGGAVGFTVGLVWLNQQNYTQRSNLVAPTVLLIAGLGLDIFSTINIARAGNKYNQALRLFNYKANQGTIQPVTLGLGSGANGFGMHVRW